MTQIYQMTQIFLHGRSYSSKQRRGQSAKMALVA